MKLLTEPQVESFLKSMEDDFDIRVPVSLHDGTRTLGRFADGPLALAGGAVLQKITHVFTPQMETLVTSSPKGLETPVSVDKPLFVVGFTAEDAECLTFLDRFYAENFRDDLYFAKRDPAVIACVTGRCGKDEQFLKISGGRCDLEFVANGQGYIVIGYTEAGMTLVDKIQDGRATDPTEWADLKAESDNLSTEDIELLETASRLLQDEKVPEEFWQGISNRCIACTSCNLVCPTCTCFDVFDRQAGDQVERWRIWDSCQLDGFMREASGHNPLGQEKLRTRRRIHHKLGADVRRWGQMSCKLCGRCDAVCPTGIGIKAVCREMVDQYGSLRPAHVGIETDDRETMDQCDPV